MGKELAGEAEVVRIRVVEIKTGDHFPTCSKLLLSRSAMSSVCMEEPPPPP
jgi:hypothetical protein